MRLYNDTILAFLGHAMRLAQDILKHECSLSVHRTRFQIGRTFYPLHLVCFEDQTRWGYFDSHFYTIGLNNKLVGRVNDVTLKNLLRHELAHYLVFIEHGATKPHGDAFKEMCRRFHWPEEVEAPSGDLLLESEGDLKADAIIEKVKKLLALANSSNSHEAELAMLKANQLILRHHLSRSELSHETMVIKPLLSAPKRTAKMMAIYDILSHFLVRPVLHMGRSIATLEAGGTREQVELAAYICDFLDHELEALWEAHRRTHRLQGLREKNSFFHGVARGYSEKLQLSRQSMPTVESRALIQIEQTVHQKVDRYLGSLSRGQSKQRLSSRANSLGRQAGRALNIQATLKDRSGERKYLN